ncbi:hypothetical protein N802_18525 [Knoellia sinensis KCTC 19936]|uniref:Uncharacterized protein n=1 Tax=Knoellia sinensis KCTC 19936 TaxID=1385520 RepID=A0A0A0J9S6_9MICO|nr:hypothetical protein [Knoellia sinensis]KGN32361.1 hypothetical protein N802_18525 [Knoellia sinensis KCTC 19936]
MNDSIENTEADGIQDKEPDRMPGGPVSDNVRDEVRIDVDEERLDAWEDVRGDYAVDPDEDMTRPALTEVEEDEDDEEALREDDEEDDLAEDEDSEDRDEEE